MKKITVFFATLVAGSVGYIINLPKVTKLMLQPEIIGPSNWAQLQKRVIPLFEEVCIESTNPTILNLANEFMTTTDVDFTRSDVLNNFLNLRTGKGMLQKGDIFTEFDQEYFDELRIISDVMIYAKTFDTFLKSAAWARQNVNCGLYVDAIYLAMIFRRDLEKLSVPAPYEVIPNYFVRKEDIMKAAYLLTVGESTFENARYEYNAYILKTEYSDDDDTKMAYFREDVGLNSYYLLSRLRNVPWLNAFDSSYGEYLYQFMKQLSTRYDLERYSNNLPELEDINWETYVPETYNPNLVYFNGTDFESSTNADVNSNTNIQFLQNIESNIDTVVTHLVQSGYNKMQIINHLMEIFVTKDKSYESIARAFLSSGANSHLSLMDHYMTALRDPSFWILNKKIVSIIDNALKSLPSYSRSELYFPGVQIVSVDVKKVMTSLDYFEFDVTDAFDSATYGATYKVKIGQNRLNNKAFTIKTTINSLVAKKGLVKIFLGPKLLPGEFTEKKKLFMFLDSFEVNLKVGSNVVSRSSTEMTSLSGDLIPLDTLRRKVEDSEFGIDALPLKSVMSQTGFPSRLILPKGAPEGLPFQLFVFIAPFEKSSIVDGRLNVQFNDAIRSPWYPLDLELENNQVLQIPNALTKEVLITHKPESKPTSDGGNYPKKDWNSNGDSDLEYTYSRSNPYAQRQYGKQDFTSKGNYGKYAQYQSTSTTEQNLSTPSETGDIVSDIFPSTNRVRPMLQLTKPKKTDISKKLNSRVSEVQNDVYNKVDKIILHNIANLDNANAGSNIKNEIFKDISKVVTKDFNVDISKDMKNDFGKEISKNFTKDIKMDISKDVFRSIKDQNDFEDTSKVLIDVKDISSKNDTENEFVSEQSTINRFSEKLFGNKAYDRTPSTQLLPNEYGDYSLEYHEYTSNRVPPVLKLISSKYKDFSTKQNNKIEPTTIQSPTTSIEKKRSNNSTDGLKELDVKPALKNVTVNTINKNDFFENNKISKVTVNIQDFKTKTLDENTENMVYSTIIKNIIQEISGDENFDVTLHFTDSEGNIMNIDKFTHKTIDKTKPEKKTETYKKDKNIVTKEYLQVPSVIDEDVTQFFKDPSLNNEKFRASVIAAPIKDSTSSINDDQFIRIDLINPMDATDFDSQRADVFDVEQRTTKDIPLNSMGTINELPNALFENVNFPAFLRAENREPSVYDYIVHPKDDDGGDSRVYE